MNIEFSVNPVILQTAKKADAEKAQRIIDGVQTAWENGQSFLSTGIFINDLFPQPRESDSDEEMAAAAKLMQDQLADLALDGAMHSISKDAVSVMCRALIDADPLASVTIYGIEMPVTELVQRWNAVHPDDKLYLEPSFEN